MAERGPVRLQRTAQRRPAARATPRPPKASAFPVLPALAATLLLLGVGQAALWWWGGRLPGAPLSFTRTYVTPPRPALPAAPVNPTVPNELVAPPLPQNVQFGDALGSVVVTFFTDPACGSCRATTQALAARLPIKGVRQVYKFWPAEATRTTPGMLVELARRQALLLPFWNALHAAGERDLNDMDLLRILEQAGLPLDTQRAALQDSFAELNAMLAPDLQLAQGAHLPPPPVVVVDTTVLDSRSLSPELLARMVKERLDGRDARREDELFLMRR